MTGVTGTPDESTGRRFGTVAADYDSYRPRYPDELVDDVVAAVPGRRVLEVGAGTGIATAAFVARGRAMTCVEPDPAMAAVLSAKFTDGSAVEVHVATFEDWAASRPPGASPFDGLISAQAWHWTDPATRWADAAAALRPGGVIALFWNEDHHADPRVLEAFTAAYDRRGIGARTVRPRLPDPDLAGDRTVPQVFAEAEGYFAEMRIHRYPWTVRVPVADYLARTNTSSAHLSLPPDVRDDLTAELLATLTGYGDGIELAMITLLMTAVRR